MLGREQELVGRALADPERLRQLARERDSARLAALRLPDLAAVELPLDVQAAGAEVDVAEAGLDRLADPESGLGQEDVEGAPLRR